MTSIQGNQHNIKNLYEYVDRAKDYVKYKMNDDYIKVQLFCESVGLPIPAKEQTDKINTIYKTHLSKNPISFQITGNTAIFELNDLEPFIEYFKKHKECKVLDIQHFSKVSKLIKFLEFVPKSQVERIIMSSEIKESLTKEEQEAIINAKTLKPTLQFDLVNSKPETKPVPVKSPANNNSSAPSSPPHASVKPAAASGTTTPNHSPNSSKESSPTSSPLSTSPEKAGNKPPIPPKRTAPSSSKEVSESTSSPKSTFKPPIPPIKVSKNNGEASTITTSTKVASHRQPPSSSVSTPQPTAQPRDIVKLKEWEEKLHDSTVEGKPAYTALLEYLILNPDKSLEECVEHIRDLRFKELKIEFKNKKIHGLLIPILMEYYHSLYPKALNSEIFELLKELRRKEKPSDEFLHALKEFEKTYKE